ncbi:spore photoproduct lyase family protein [Nocardia abscessus]|uniref:spore photoproduct lyase family protein n=1 Tax=Nocardia abscessus TaxID=120957 RepID=UPI001E406F9B|nr:hypothetical protein [Nocardia abscessus]
MIRQSSRPLPVHVGPRLLDVRRVWAEPDALASPRGRQVRARFPDAEVITVASHWKIDELHGNAGTIDRWIRVKTEDLVLGIKKSLTARENGRSADWIAPSTSNGCAMACAYCYVPRRKGSAFKAQAPAEFIMLTHNEQLHELNLGWHPEVREPVGVHGDPAGQALPVGHVERALSQQRQGPPGSRRWPISLPSGRPG